MTLESRLAKLERQAFLLRSTLVAGSFVLVVVATTGLVQQRGIEKVVRAEQFELRTTEGRRLGWWGVVGGSPTFALFGSNPTLPTVAISLTDSGGVIELHKDHRPVSDDVMFDGTILGAAGIVLSHPGSGQLRMGLYGPGEQREFGLLLSDETGVAILGHASVVDRSTGATTRYPVTTLVFYDPQGNVRYKVP